MSLHKALHARLLDGIDEIGLEVTPQSLAALEAYLALVLKWRSKMNLVSIAAEHELITHHALDSLVLAPILKAPDSKYKNILDFGTGAGFPGMSLAAVLPTMHFALLDSRQRRMEFLRMVALQANINNISLHTARVEADFAMHASEKFDTLIARAVAPLSDLVSMTANLRCQGQQLLAMKGQYPQAELDALHRDHPAQILSATVQPLAVPGLDAERHLVTIEFSPQQ